MGGHTVGIVETLDEITNETKFRIGVGDGAVEWLDEESIAQTGATFDPKLFIRRVK